MCWMVLFFFSQLTVFASPSGTLFLAEKSDYVPSFPGNEIREVVLPSF